MANRLSSTYVWVEWAIRLCNWWAWPGWETRSGWTGLLDLLKMGLFLSWYITAFQIHMFRLNTLKELQRCSIPQITSHISRLAELVQSNRPSRVGWELWCGRYLSNMFKPQHQTAKERPWKGWIPDRARLQWCGKYLASHITNNAHDRIVALSQHRLPRFLMLSTAEWRRGAERWAFGPGDEVIQWISPAVDCHVISVTSVLALTLWGLWVQNCNQRICAN